MLFARLDFGVDAHFHQTCAEGIVDGGNQLLAMTTGFGHGGFQHTIAHRVHRLEGQVFEFMPQRVNPQPVGDGGVDFQRFLRDAATFFRAQRIQRAHVVQAVSQLDDDDANIFRHRQQNFLDVVGLLLDFVLELDVGELADAIDQIGDFFTKLFLDLLARGGGVFDDIMQNGCNDAVHVHMHFRENAGDSDGVVDVRLTGDAVLAFVQLRAKQVGAVNFANLVLLHVAADQVA